MKRLLLFVVAALFCGQPAMADPGHGKGHDKHGDGGPPGLAKKPYGLPPGQAKKMWRQGERIPRVYYSEPQYVVVRPDRYRLRPAPVGYRWVLVEDDAYLVRRDSGLIADIVADAVTQLLR
jgi:Ni/Co efflux regulator RcnB